MFALDRPDYNHELLSVPRCTQLVSKLPTTKLKDEWVRQIEREQVSDDVKGLAEWAQLRAKTLRKREREQPTIPTKERFSRGCTQLSSKSPRNPSTVTTTNPALSPRKCSLCGRDHSEVTCPTLLVANLKKHWGIVKTRKVSFGCLKRGYQRRQYRQSRKCGVN